MWLRGSVAVAVAQAGSCSSDLTPSLGTFIYRRCSPKKQKNIYLLENTCSLSFPYLPNADTFHIYNLI